MRCRQGHRNFQPGSTLQQSRSRGGSRADLAWYDLRRSRQADSMPKFQDNPVQHSAQSPAHVLDEAVSL
jgi:hypothetical protein